MEFDLKEIGATTLIGAFVFLCCEAYLYYFLQIDLTGFFRGRFGFESRETLIKEGDPAAFEVDPPFPFTVFAGIAILFGIFSEDLAVRIVDTRPGVLSAAATAASTLLVGSDSFAGVRFPQYGDKSAVRIEEVVKNFNAKESDTSIAKPTELGHEMGELGVLKAVCGIKPDSNKPESGASTQTQQAVETKVLSPSVSDLQKTLEIPTACKEDGCQPTKAELWQECLIKLYHTAKNRVYAEPTYFQELERFEVRRHLTASFAVYSSLFATPVLLFLLIGTIAPWRSPFEDLQQRIKRREAAIEHARKQAIKEARAAVEAAKELGHPAPVISVTSPPAVEESEKNAAAENNDERLRRRVASSVCGVFAIALFTLLMRNALAHPPKDASNINFEVWGCFGVLFVSGIVSLVYLYRALKKACVKPAQYRLVLWTVVGCVISGGVSAFLLVGQPVVPINWLASTETLALHLVAASILLLALSIVWTQQKFRAEQTHRLLPRDSNPMTRLGITIVMFVALAAIALGSLWATHYESGEETRRVYGYLVTLFRQEQDEQFSPAGILYQKDRAVLKAARDMIAPASQTEQDKTR